MIGSKHEFIKHLQFVTLKKFHKYIALNTSKIILLKTYSSLIKLKLT